MSNIQKRWNIVESSYEESFRKIQPIYREAFQKSHPFLSQDQINSNYKNFKKSFEKESSDKIYVIKQGKQVVGFCCFFLQEEQEIALTGIFIKPEYQNKGYGTHLLNHIKSLCKSINLAVYSENSKAIKFYQKCEFSKVGEESDGSPYWKMRWSK